MFTFFESAAHRRLIVSRVRRLMRFARDRVAEIDIAEVASSMALATLLAIVPVLALSLALFAAFPSFADSRKALEDFIVSGFLPAQYSELLINYLRDFATHAAGLTTFGLAGLAVTALLLIDKLFVTVNRIFKVRVMRPWVQRTLIYWALMTVGPVAVALSVTLTGRAAAAALSGIDSETGGFLFSLGQILLQGFGFAVLYKYIPNCRVPAAHALIGGFTAALAGFVVKFGFEYYVTAGTLTNIYGAFVALPVLILWIYVAWFLFFAGAAVTATIPKLTTGRYMDSYRTGNDFLTALLILKLFVKRWTMSERPVIGLAELCDAADTYPESCDRVLSRLAHIGFVAPMAEDKHQSWVLTVDPARAVLQPVFEEFCADPKVSLVNAGPAAGGESAGALKGFWSRMTESTVLIMPLRDALAD